MRQNIDIKQEKGRVEMIGTVRRTDKRSRLGGKSEIFARNARGSAFSDVLRVESAAVSPLDGGLKVNVRKRTFTSRAGAMTPSPHQKFQAEPLQARSADLVSEINVHVGGIAAALIIINQKTEQHRCNAV